MKKIYSIWIKMGIQILANLFTLKTNETYINKESLSYKSLFKRLMNKPLYSFLNSRIIILIFFFFFFIPPFILFIFFNIYKRNAKHYLYLNLTKNTQGNNPIHRLKKLFIGRINLIPMMEPRSV